MSLFWIAKYRDGKAVPQIQDGVEISFDSISRDGLWYVNLVDPSGRVALCHEFYVGQKPFYRRRVALRPGCQPVVVHILGYRIEEYTQCVFVNENDGSIVIGDFRKQNESKIYAGENRYSIEYHPADDLPVT